MSLSDRSIRNYSESYWFLPPNGAGSNLYQIMPVNGQVGLEHSRASWSSGFDFQAIDGRRDVQVVRNELAASGHALLNLRISYQWKLV